MIKTNDRCLLGLMELFENLENIFTENNANEKTLGKSDLYKKENITLL